MRLSHLLVLFALLPQLAVSQKMPVDELSTSGLVSPIGGAFNRIFNDYHLDSLYSRLAAIKKTGRGVLRIVHIGDSHVQGGYFTGVLRKGLQDFFGDAGRGIVFPYAGVKTNSPPDIQSLLLGSWLVNKLVVSGNNEEAGVSGFGLETNSAGAGIQITVGNTQAKRLRLFAGREPGAGWLLRTADGSQVIKPEKNIPWVEITLNAPTDQLTLATLPSDKKHRFSGISLESGGPGIIYHAVGVNGARFDQYNRSKSFWEELPGLEADLYIVSLGTNDAQRNLFDEKEFRKILDEFLKKLEKASPQIPVLFTTAPDSYRAGRPNPVIRDLNLALFEYCTANGLAAWDLYRVTNGYGSAAGWLRKGLMRPDRIHFTQDGYQVQGQLFLNALAKSYNAYHAY